MNKRVCGSCLSIVIFDFSVEFYTFVNYFGLFVWAKNKPIFKEYWNTYFLYQRDLDLYHYEFDL